MTEATQFDMSWPMDNLLDRQTTVQDLSPHPFIAGDFSFGLQEESDPVWSEGFNWSEYENTPKADTFQPYPQLWYEAGLVRQNTMDESILPQPIPNPENLPIQLRNALATERALFMTPSPNTAFPLPTSPSMDPLSPVSSQSHASVWEEGERDREEGLYIGTFEQGQGHAQNQGSVQSQTQSHMPRRYSEYSTSTSTHRMDEEEALTPLEMPDGSTRFTSNWLPVDPDAGFTIGSPGIPGYEDEIYYGDLQNAFFPSKPASLSWSYGR